MTTIFADANGVQMKDFLKKYKETLKGKHVLYAVSTNLEEDRQIRRSTRNTLGGVNIKIGKATADPAGRLKSYTNMASNYSKEFTQSGVRVMMIRVYAKRKDFETGNSKVNEAEILLKRTLRDAGRSVKVRGSEIFNVDPNELFDIVENIDLGDYQYETRRVSERLGKRLVWLTTDVETGKEELKYATDYDETMRRYAEANKGRMDERSKFITQYFIRPPRRVVQGFSGGIPEQRRETTSVQGSEQDDSISENLENSEGQGDNGLVTVHPQNVDRLVSIVNEYLNTPPVPRFNPDNRRNTIFNNPAFSPSPLGHSTE